MKLFENHEVYNELAEEWNLFVNSYEGGRKYIEYDNYKYLYRHFREEAQDYRDRRTRAYYLNYCKPIIDIYQSHIQRKGVIRKTASEQRDWLQFIEDVDRNGSGIDEFWLNKVFPAAQVYGFAYILVDMANDVQVLTEAERRENRLLPHLVLYYPSAVINWQVTNNKFDWIVFKEVYEEKYDNPIEKARRKNKGDIYQYRVWTKDWWGIFNDHGKILAGGPDEGINRLGEVPIVVVANKWSIFYDYPVGISALQTIAYLNRAIYNLTSLLDEFLYRQCFNQLMLDEELIGKIVQVGLSNAIPVSKDSFVPQYLTPPTEAAQFLVEQIDHLITEIYRHAIVRDTVAITKQAESGLSKAFDFHDANQNISSKSANMEKAERKVTKLFFKWLGKENENDVEITYPRDFNIKTINEEIADTVEIFKSDLGSLTLNRELAKGVAQRLVSDPALKERIAEEINESNPGYDLEQRLRLLESNVYSVLDLIKNEYPDFDDTKAEDKLNRNLDINTRFLKRIQQPPQYNPQESMVARLKEKGLLK